MAYFAKVENNIVTGMFDAPNVQWCIDYMGGEWVQTYRDTPNKNYAGIGYIYDPILDDFIAPLE